MTNEYEITVTTADGVVLDVESALLDEKGHIHVDIHRGDNPEAVVITDISVRPHRLGGLEVPREVRDGEGQDDT